MPFNNVYLKTPETVWPLHVWMTLQDEHGQAIEVPDVRSDLYGVAAESPAMGDTVTVRVGEEFQKWRVAERHWENVLPADGQVAPCSVLFIGLRRVSTEVEQEKPQ